MRSYCVKVRRQLRCRLNFREALISRGHALLKKGRMGITHPSKILEPGKERGNCLFLFSFGERLEQQPRAIASLWHPTLTFY